MEAELNALKTTVEKAKVPPPSAEQMLKTDLSLEEAGEALDKLLKKGGA